VVTGSLSDPTSPLCDFKALAAYDAELLRQITRTLLDSDTADVLVAGLKIFMPVSFLSKSVHFNYYLLIIYIVILSHFTYLHINFCHVLFVRSMQVQFELLFTNHSRINFAVIYSAAHTTKANLPGNNLGKWDSQPQTENCIVGLSVYDL